jgi:hypothetical protein
MNRQVTGGSTNAEDVDSLPLAAASNSLRDAVAHEDIASSHPFLFIPRIRLRICTRSSRVIITLLEFYCVYSEAV